MTDVIRLPAGIEIRACPGCGYLESQTFIAFARYDFDCPRCRKHKLSEFLPDTDPEPPKSGKRKAG